MVAPSARQRGVAGALVEFVAAARRAQAQAQAQPAGGPAGGGPAPAALVAQLPPYKNREAKATIEAFFETRGIAIHRG